MFLEEPLQKIGLSEKEAKIYLAALELGEDTVSNIAKKAEIKRPTAYVILEELVAKGYVSEKPKHKGSTYIAESPENLKSILKEKEKAFGEALPFLRAMYNVEKGKPQVRVYEGIEGMKQIYTQTVWKSKTEILFFSSIRKIYETIPGLLDTWVDDMTKGGVYQHETKEFINPDPVDIDYSLRAMKANPNQQVRVIPKDFPYKFIGTDNAIFEDKIMMVSFEEKLFTTVIQSKAIVETMKTLFNLAWGQAIPLKDFIKQHPEIKPKRLN
jgi:HTH-type transcriptional regulator, sugar sensing transcriptional regulator